MPTPNTINNAAAEKKDCPTLTSRTLAGPNAPSKAQPGARARRQVHAQGHGPLDRRGARRVPQVPRHLRPRVEEGRRAHHDAHGGPDPEPRPEVLQEDRGRRRGRPQGREARSTTGGS